VQYWNGSVWVDVPGGNVTGNNLVWRRFIFDPISTRSHSAAGEQCARRQLARHGGGSLEGRAAGYRNT